MSWGKQARARACVCVCVCENVSESELYPHACTYVMRAVWMYPSDETDEEW